MKCIKCGNCCRSRAIDITWTDILRWEEEDRWDILKEVSYVNGVGFNRCYFEKSLKKKDDMNRQCPFLSEHNECLIHDTKPSGCKDAPLAYKVFDECPVFEKSSDEVIEKMVKKQTEDILMVGKNLNIIMQILVRARENWQI